MNTVPISEIFMSIQGEGIFIGQKFNFVRLYGCNLDCFGCDERNKPVQEMTLENVLKEIEKLPNTDIRKRVAITGGEPLVYSQFVGKLALLLKSKGYFVLLETNGTMYDKVSEIVDCFDYSSVDIKLSSVWKIDSCYDKHEIFMREINKRPYYIKIVISEGVNKREYLDYIQMVAQINNDIALILHPWEKEHISMSKELLDVLMECQTNANRYLSDVRILPRLQTQFGLQ